MKTQSGQLPIRNLPENLMLMAFMILMLLILSFQNAASQKIQKRTKPVSVWVILRDGSKLHGKVTHVSRDSIWVLLRGNISGVSAERIESIRVRGSGKVAEGILYGSAIGAVAGGLASLVVTSQGSDTGSWSNISNTTPSIAFVLSGFVAGGTIGGAIGMSSKTTYEIKGSAGKFRLFLTEAGLNERIVRN